MGKAFVGRGRPSKRRLKKLHPQSGGKVMVRRPVWWERNGVSVAAPTK